MYANLLGYFLVKKHSNREKADSEDQKTVEAMEIATKIMRVCYPKRMVHSVHCYLNKDLIEPFLSAQYPGDKEPDRYGERIIVIDAYFMFDDAYSTITEDRAFVVEVAFPQDIRRVRWSVARVRWYDLGWKSQGRDFSDNPVNELSGETFVNLWA